MNGKTPGKKPRRAMKPPGSPGPMRTMSFWFLVVIMMIVALQVINSGKPREHKITYSRFMEQLEDGNLKSVRFDGQRVSGELATGIEIQVKQRPVSDVRHFFFHLPFDAPDLLETIRAKSDSAHPIEIDSKEPGLNWGTIFYAWGPILLLVVLWFFLIRQMQGGSNRAFSFGKSRAKLVAGDRPLVTFDDVAGAVEAKTELRELVEFLSDPKKFQRMGARIPRGALLVGPPGTGKTLLAKAVAGEADVPFFSMSGSEFVEMFVGVGASRVRDLFEQGKKSAPCIIFVDELDAVGRHRGAGLGGGHDEREQTLNQLLVEMDGFDTNDGVIILSATNRPDVLDPALLRPGRFDRQIVVDMPDIKGREGILKVHMRKVKIADEVDVELLARATPGLSGADLANIVNEAALLAARRNRDSVVMKDFEDAKDKVMLGPERGSQIPTEETRRIVACHEAGHATAGVLLPEADALHKVTIVSRGRAGGLTYFLPRDEHILLHDRDYLVDNITMALGGLCAEELVFGKITNGASNDIKRVTDIARRMITQWGMSEKLGPIAYGENEETVFLGRSISHTQNFSERTAQMIDDEVHELVESCKTRCTEILDSNREVLDKLTDELLLRETLTGDEVSILLEGGKLPPFDAKKAEEERKKETMSIQDKVEAVLEEAERLGEPGASGIETPEPKPAKEEPAGTDKQPGTGDLFEDGD